MKSHRHESINSKRNKKDLNVWTMAEKNPPKNIVRSGIRTHAWRTRLRPERSALDRSAILTSEDSYHKFNTWSQAHLKSRSRFISGILYASCLLLKYTIKVTVTITTRNGENSLNLTIRAAYSEQHVNTSLQFRQSASLGPVSIFWSSRRGSSKSHCWVNSNHNNKLTNYQNCENIGTNYVRGRWIKKTFDSFHDSHNQNRRSSVRRLPASR